MLKITKHTATIQDFLQLKPTKPFKEWRNKVGKGLNFQMIFGAAASGFAGTLEKADFTPTDCEEFITKSGNAAKLRESLLQNMQQPTDKRKTQERIMYEVSATLMREGFFNMYKGLMERIMRENKFASEHFYIRDWHGTVRFLPEFFYMNYAFNGGEKPSLLGSDKKFFSTMFAHATNQAANSAVQTGECIPIYSTWVDIDQYAHEWNLKSWAGWNSTHDSLDMYIYRDELQVVFGLSCDAMAVDRPPVEGIHMRFDPELSDVSLPSKREKMYYKHGVEIEHDEFLLPLEKALEQYNSWHPEKEPLKFHGFKY